MGSKLGDARRDKEESRRWVQILSKFVPHSGDIITSPTCSSQAEERARVGGYRSPDRSRVQ